MTRARVVLLAALALAACDRTRWLPREDCGRANASCTTHEDCCSFACGGDGTCACAPAGEHCLVDLACCGGGACVDERCAEGDGVACSDRGESCVDSGDCCEGLDCSIDECVPEGDCAPTGEFCDETTPCCADLAACVDGSCQEPACRAQGVECGIDAPCCDDGGDGELYCGGSGRCTYCLLSGNSCVPDESDDPCCGRSTCSGSTCCGIPTESCDGVGECCSILDGEFVNSTCNSQSLCCLERGSACQDDADCCSGSCTTTGCECMPVGGECQFDFDCCTGTMCHAVDATCCTPSDLGCSLDADCCSGDCKANNTCA